MKIILTLVVLATCLITTSLGAPQIFPFSNLRSYFDHQTRHGPGDDKAAVVPETATAVDTPLFRLPSNIGDIQVKTVSSSPTKHPQNQLPTNHKPDISPSLEPPSASAAASPVVKYHPPIPEQVLKAPDAAPPILYGPITEQDKTNENYQIPQVTPGVVSQFPISVVGEKKYKLFGGFVPLVHPQALLSPPAASEPKSVFPYLATVPSQDVKSPKVSFKYPEEYVTQKEQDDLEAPKQVSPAKIAKAPNHSYPKKWQPEKEKSKPAVRKNSSKTDVRNLSNLNNDNDSNQPKNEREEAREHQKIPAALQTASSFQKPDFTFFPTQAKPKVPGIDEQITSETGFSGITAGVGGYEGGGGGGDRVEFQMHGQQGPHSYKFGYDTGKGHNRQFRYEERDTHGHVKGHYGFYNKHGKLQIVNYSAHPEHGFQADGNYGKHGIV